METFRTRNKSFFNWITISGYILMVLPLAIFATGYQIVVNRDARGKILAATSIMKSECEDLKRKAGNSEEYFARQVKEVFWNSWTNAELLKTRIIQLLRETEIDAKVLIWNNDLDTQYSNFVLKNECKDLRGAFRAMFKIFDRNQNLEGSKEHEFYDLSRYPGGELINLRSLLGHAFYPELAYKCVHPVKPVFLKTSLNPDDDLIWFYAFKNCGLLLFVPPDQFKSFSSLKFEIAKRNAGENLPGKLFLIENHQLFPKIDELSKELKQLLHFQKSFSNSIIDSGNLLVSKTYLSETISLLGIVEKKSWLNDEITLKIWGLTITWSMLILWIFWTRVIDFGYIFKLKLKTHLLLFFIISNFLPFLGFVSISYDFLQEYKLSRISELQRQSLKCLKNVSEFSIVSISHWIEAFEKAIPEMRIRLFENGIDERSIEWFLKKQKPGLEIFFLTGSHTQEIAFDKAIIDQTKIVKNFSNVDFTKNDHLIKQARVTDIISKSILADLNGEKQSDKQGLELEMVFDSLSQGGQIEFKQSYFEAQKKLWKRGFGDDLQHTNYVRLLSVFKPEIYDYNLVAVLNGIELARAFIEKYFHSLNRNPHGLKIWSKQVLLNIFPQK